MMNSSTQQNNSLAAICSDYVTGIFSPQQKKVTAASLRGGKGKGRGNGLAKKAVVAAGAVAAGACMSHTAGGATSVLTVIEEYGSLASMGTTGMLGPIVHVEGVRLSGKDSRSVGSMGFHHIPGANGIIGRLLVDRLFGKCECCRLKTKLFGHEAWCVIDLKLPAGKRRNWRWKESKRTWGSATKARKALKDKWLSRGGGQAEAADVTLETEAGLRAHFGMCPREKQTSLAPNRS